MFLGTSAQCEQTRKTISQSSSDGLTGAISSSESIDENQKDSQLPIKDNHQWQNQKSSSMMPASKSKVTHNQLRGTATKKNSANTQLSKTHHDIVQAENTLEETTEAVLVVNRSHQIDKQTQKRKKSNREKEPSKKDPVMIKRIPHNSKRLSLEI